MTSQIPFTPLTPESMGRLTLDEQLAFEAAACAVAGDQKPSLEVAATPVLTVARLIGEAPGSTLPVPASDDTGRHSPAAHELAQERTGPVTDEAVDASLAVVADFWRDAHAVLQCYPSRALARAMLQGAAPVMAGDVAARLAAIGAHAPAIVDALRHALAYVEHVPGPSAQAATERYRSALAVIGGEEAGHA